MTFTNKIYPYTFPTAGAGTDDFEGWIEHGLAFKCNFVLDLTKSAFINSFEALLVAYKSADGTYFELDKYVFNLDNTLVTIGANTYQLLTVNNTRGYPLLAGNEKNLVTITVDQASLVGTSPSYDVEFSQKIHWEDWIKNFDVNPIFTDYNEPQNNLNFKASNYVTLGYKIKMLFKFNVAGVSYLGVAANTDYLFFTPNLVIRDYDVDGNATPKFTQTIETFTLGGVSLGVGLNALIQVGVDTLMKITWVYVTPPILDIVGWWAIHRIEENGETGQQLFELGTTETNPTSNNILTGITTNVLDMAIVGGNVETTCYIDGSQIIAGKKYNLSGEICSGIRK